MRTGLRVCGIIMALFGLIGLGLSIWLSTVPESQSAGREIFGSVISLLAAVILGIGLVKMQTWAMYLVIPIGAYAIWSSVTALPSLSSGTQGLGAALACVFWISTVIFSVSYLIRARGSARKPAA